MPKRALSKRRKRSKRAVSSRFEGDRGRVTLRLIDDDFELVVDDDSLRTYALVSSETTAIGPVGLTLQIVAFATAFGAMAGAWV